MTTVKKLEMTDVGINENVLVQYEKHSLLFGLVSWWVKVRSESQGKELIINTAEKYDNIIINGKAITIS